MPPTTLRVALFGDLMASGTAALLADHAANRKLDGDPPDAYKTVQYVYGRVAVAAWKIAVERLIDQGQARDRAQPAPGARGVPPRRRRGLRHDRLLDDRSPAAVGGRITQLGPHGRMETIGQPLSLQSGWLGW